jgi:hypothetical protein
MTLQAPRAPDIAPDIAPGRRKRVLLVDGDKAQLSGMTKVLRPVVAGDVESRDSLGELPEDGECDLVAVNYDGLSPAERDVLIGSFSSFKRQTRLLLISAGQCKRDFDALFGRYALTNLIANNGVVDAEDLIVTVQKILRRDVFGIEKYFIWGVQVISMRLSRSTDKGRLLAEAEEYAKRIGIRSRLVSLFCTVADELVTNAIYNAPRSPDGQSRYSHLPRIDHVALDAGEEIEVKFCCDGRRLGIAAIDPFGSLTQERVLDYLAKCFRKGDDQIDQKPGGAGLGFYYIFEAVSHFVVNLSVGKRTEMIGLIDIRGGYRNFAGSTKSFNIFTGE